MKQKICMLTGANKVQLDFRRPCTIAKGSAVCEFYYYRQGHAPVYMVTV